MRYYSGDRVAISGTYHSAHIFHREHDADHELTAGQSFPRCCGAECRDVMYTLIKITAALGVHEDKDLKISDTAESKPASAAAHSKF